MRYTGTEMRYYGGTKMRDAGTEARDAGTRSLVRVAEDVKKAGRAPGQRHGEINGKKNHCRAVCTTLLEDCH
eukprot:3393990-Rhodomonas_salina.2